MPLILAAKTYEAGCKKAKVSKACFYGWLKDEGFAAEFDRQRSKIAEAAFGMIAQNIEKAVSVLVRLLDTGDDRVKRLASNDIIGHFLKHRELDDLEERVQRVEEQIETRR